jgi:Putative transposase
MEPLEFMERMAALVPRPRLHLIRFHGVLAPNAKLRSQIVPAPAERAVETSSEDAHAQGEIRRMSWPRLLKRVFDIDIEHCPNCGGALRIIAAIDDPPVIVKILSHLGLPTRGPPRAPARRVDLFQTIWGAKSRLPTQADGAARSEFDRAAHKEPFARHPTALRPSGPVQQWIFHQAEKELTTLPGLRYSSGHRKGRLKILSILKILSF